MTRMAVVAAVFAVVLGLTPAGAGAGGGGGCGAVTNVGGVLYIDDRGNGDPLNTWVYAESNGQAGLQAGGRALHGVYEDVDCNQSRTPDQLVY